MKFNIALVLLVVIFSTSLGSNPEYMPLSFPIFNKVQNPDGFAELMVGYGDWCASIEGLHMGLDFFAPSHFAKVVNPFDKVMYSLGADYSSDDDYTGYIIGVGVNGSCYGWAIEHLGLDVYNYELAQDWVDIHKKGTEIPARAPIDTCSQYSGSVPLHTHIQWSHWEYNSNEDRYIMHNPWEELYNPFDFFIGSPLKGFDLVGFKQVSLEESWVGGATPRNRGCFFFPEGISYFIQYRDLVGVSSISSFQNVLHGVLDIVASPYSKQVNFPDSNGCGVHSIGYEILRQNPFSLDWESTASTEGNWGGKGFI